ncbi:hypothetical protein BGZ73_005158 [Actinomortierella ambigua]|nr:hypothetical protein BGZ73_005158 [Actinomortierella ambigua]
MHHLRANMAGGPPSIAPRTSSRDYGLSHGFNGVGRGLVPGSPSSPVVNTSNKSGPSLNERRNTPSALHIQTQSLADPSGYRRMNGHGQVSGPEPDHYYAYPNHAMHSEATVVGGTLGFGRRQSHKRNHSSADVIQYPPPVPPKTVKPRSVQVTIDNENFKRLDVSAIENASYLKKLIFEKLDIRAERDKYGIFETTELGSALVDATSHGVPQLTDAQLLELATTADNKGTTKLLVTPIKPLILPRDLDLMNPQRAAVAVGNHGRSTPYQHPQYQHSQAQSDLYHPHHPHAHALPLHTRDKTYESPHLYRDDPYFNTFAHQPDEAWGSIHPHQQAYSDSKHPHAGGRHPTPLPPLPGPTSANGTPPYGGYQQQMYRFVNDPGHPHYQGDGGPSSARTSPRVGPVVSTSQSRMMGKGGGVPSPGVDGSGINNTGNNNSSSQPRYSPLANRKALAGNPRLSLVIGSNTDQDGKLLNRGLNDHSASPGGTLGYPPRSHNGRSMTPNAYKNQSPGGSPYTEANRSGPFGLGEISPFGFGGNMSTGLPASPLSAGGKRSSFQTMTRYANSNPNSPRSSHPISSDTGSGERSGDHDDYREIRGSPMYSNNGYGGSTFNLHFLGGDGASSHLGLDGASNGLTSSTAVNTNNNLNRSQDHMEDDEGQFWGERPPLVFMLENFPQFFQGYDMDHPLIELQPPTPFQEQPPNAGSPLHHAAGLHGGNTGVMGGGSHQGSQGSLPRQQQQQLRGGQGQSPSEVASPATTADGWGSNSTMASGTYSGGSLYMTGGSGSRGSIVHTKSIRNVAQEAKDRFSKQFGSNMVRRKSTKMWGSRLAEVMPTHAAPMPSVGLGVQEEEDRDHEREQDHQPGQLSPIAGSPGGILHRSSIASMIEEAAQEHHILPPKEADHDHVPEGEVEEEVDEEHELDEDHTATSYEDQHVPEPLQTLPHQLATSQRQQQRPVVHMEAGKVMDRSQQGIYQHPQSGAIRTFRYLKGGLIGRGSFGRVYHAFNLDTCEMIAVKQVDLPTTLSERNCDRLKTSVKALFDEMEVLKDLEHENIVQYLGFSHTDDTANIFLEYVSGGSIESCLKRSGPFPEAVIKFFSRQILLGLEYIHSKRIVHRDIKAANVLVDEQGTCKISDFGISKRNAASQGGYDEDVGSLQGSVFWMAPEMVTSKAYGAKVDIWSFGCLVLEMFTGQQPWKGYAPQQALFTIGSSSAHPPIPETICEEGQRLLARCFITDANLRPTAAELLQDPFVAEQPTFKFSDYIEGKMD